LYAIFVQCFCQLNSSLPAERYHNTNGFFELDDVLLEFNEEALNAIAEKAIERSTGARGLRAIIEETMMEVMFDIPSQANVEKCLISKESVTNGDVPELVYNENKKSIKKPVKKARVKRESVS
jgi:ATP-dependent Clp protease ATP-binding subunit ClpX